MFYIIINGGKEERARSRREEEEGITILNLQRHAISKGSKTRQDERFQVSNLLNKKNISNINVILRPKEMEQDL